MSNRFDFNYLTVLRDAYRAAYAEAKTKRDEDAKKARADYLGDRLKTEIANIKKQFSDSVTAEKNRLRDEIETALNTERDRINNYVQRGSTAFIGDLELISHIPVSAVEFGNLCKRYAGQTYWADRMLTLIAQKNDILGDYGIDPPAADLLAILDEATEEIDLFFEKWDGDSFAGFNLLTDRKILSWERAYGNVYDLDAEQIAHRSFVNLMLETDQMKRGIRLAETLRNYGDNENAREFLLWKISQSATFGESALYYAGNSARQLVNDYRTGKKSKPVLIVEEEPGEIELTDAEKETAAILTNMVKTKPV